MKEQKLKSKGLKVKSTECKHSEGITLIALIITIIVLLILAVVSIRLVINNGILGKSEYATQKYSEAEADEQEKLLKVEYEMAKYEGKFSGTYTDYALDKKYGLKIGDYVAYNEAGTGNYTTDTSKGIGGSVRSQDSTTGKDLLNEQTYTTEDLGWRVLGLNAKGQLELISDNPMSEEQKVYLANEEGYLYGAEELNTMCKTLYGNGTGTTGKVVSTGARSLNADDIDKLAGITTEEQKKAVNSRYGSLWQYQFPSGGTYLQYRTSTDNGATWTDWADITNLSWQTFRMPGAASSSTMNSTNPGVSETLKHTYYYYSISDYVKQITSDGTSIADIITKGTGTSNIAQWLASPVVFCYSNIARFNLRYVALGSVSRVELFYSNDAYISSNCFRVRPVVSLKSDIQIEKTSTNDGSTLAKACTIK